ncbi:MAG: hypothetical protein CVV34_04835, partial [Methanomicrobiales archaeon HGW-Methanomicrobiales-5]
MLESALTSVELSLKQAIRKQDDGKVEVFTRLLNHLICAWIEVRILKLLYEPKAFADSEIDEVLHKTTPYNKSDNPLNEKWKKALTIAYLKAYPKKDPSKDMRYQYLMDLIGSDFLESIEERNRLAHGQWKYAFNSALTKINHDITKRINHENIVKLQAKHRIFRDIAQIIHDLAVSEPTFDRDFDKYYKNVKENKILYEKMTVPIADVGQIST